MGVQYTTCVALGFCIKQISFFITFQFPPSRTTKYLSSIQQQSPAFSPEDDHSKLIKLWSY